MFLPQAILPQGLLLHRCKAACRRGVAAELLAAHRLPERPFLPFLQVSVNDCVIKAAALALAEVPAANSFWDAAAGAPAPAGSGAPLRRRHFARATATAVVPPCPRASSACCNPSPTNPNLHFLRRSPPPCPPAVDIAIAVATEGGLITPIIRAANTKPLDAISAEVCLSGWGLGVGGARIHLKGRSRAQASCQAAWGGMTPSPPPAMCRRAGAGAGGAGAGQQAQAGGVPGRLLFNFQPGHVRGGQVLRHHQPAPGSLWRCTLVRRVPARACCLGVGAADGRRATPCLHSSLSAAYAPPPPFLLPTQACIMAVGGARQVACMQGGRPAVKSQMTVTLSGVWGLAFRSCFRLL